MTANPPRFRGVFTVVQTPYTDNGLIDYEILGAEIDWVFQHGVDGLTIALASELLRLTSRERRDLGTRTVEFCNGRGPVVISVGGESTTQAREFARAAEDAGADAVMAIPPLSVRCGEDELRGYFEGILKEVSLPLVIQDASAYLGAPLSIEFQCAMAEEYGPRILFKPEAEPVGPVICALQETSSGKTLIFEGSGGLNLLDNYQQGCTGSMPACDVPWAIVRLWKELEAGNTEKARNIQEALTSLVSMMSSSLDAFIAGEKHFLVRQGIFRNASVRGPAGYRPDRETIEELDRRFEYLQRTVGRDTLGS